MIVTFYSYKGGVGRSMALANIADLLARSGLRVLIVDFDLEAPGLEHFFPIDHDLVRGKEGLLDLLLAYKHSMSAASSVNEKQDTFRELDRFVTTIYPVRSGGGRLDLLSAGQRRTDDQLVRYGLELRQFDWLNFYFAWSGELFFEWLRRTLADCYDVVLIDSRTGVTEMGGICAYQLADVIVAFCAPNLQNIAGTETMVRHFLSPAVRGVRGGRPIGVLIVPARIEQDDTGLRQAFRQRFDHYFAAYLPGALADAGLTLWDLQIPYEPRYAFDEQVVTDPDRVEERRGLAAAYGRLLTGIALLAPPESPLASLGHVSGLPERERARGPVETRYDPTTRFAPPDVYIWFGSGAAEAAEEVAALLSGEPGLTAMVAPGPQAGTIPRAASAVAQKARLGLVLVSGDPDWRLWQQHEVEQFLALDRPVIPVVLPGADRSQVPPWLQDIAYLDFGARIDMQLLLVSVRGALSPAARKYPNAREFQRSPYVGSRPFTEEDADVFFGREQVVAQLVSHLMDGQTCIAVGPAGVGKTSVVFAGLIPALRRGVLPGSDRWPIVSLRVADGPVSALSEALTALVTGKSDARDSHPGGPTALNALMRERYERVLLVIDQMEELFTPATSSERDQFIRYLRELREDGKGSAPVLLPVLVLRAEILAEALEHRDLANWYVDGAVLISPLDSQALRQTIEAPAASVGVTFEPGLVDRLMTDVANEPGALPLLQSALYTLWAAQRDGYLTHEGYERTGGIPQALTRRADEVLDAMSAADQRIARDLLLRLVTVTDEETRTRGFVEVSELLSGLESADHPAAEVRSILTWLTDSRLLVTSVNSDGATSVGMAHEALISAWPTLRGWIEDRHAALLARSRLDAAVAEWQKLSRDSSALYTWSRLRQLLSAMDDKAPLSQLQQSYVQACWQRARLRRLLASALTVILLLAAGGVVLYLRSLNAAFHVTGVTITPHTSTGCTVNVTGRITTNGAAGTVSYQWLFQPGSQAPQPLDQSVVAGQREVDVTVAVEGQGHGHLSQQVTLQVLSPERMTASAQAVLRCP
jgi:cellulose biosynthesis protein BcsQ